MIDIQIDLNWLWRNETTTERAAELLSAEIGQPVSVTAVEFAGGEIFAWYPIDDVTDRRIMAACDTLPEPL